MCKQRIIRIGKIKGQKRNLSLFSPPSFVYFDSRASTIKCLHADETTDPHINYSPQAVKWYKTLHAMKVTRYFVCFSPSRRGRRRRRRRRIARASSSLFFLHKTRDWK